MFFSYNVKGASGEGSEEFRFESLSYPSDQLSIHSDTIVYLSFDELIQNTNDTRSNLTEYEGTRSNESKPDFMKIFKNMFQVFRHQKEKFLLIENHLKKIIKNPWSFKGTLDEIGEALSYTHPERMEYLESDLNYLRLHCLLEKKCEDLLDASSKELEALKEKLALLVKFYECIMQIYIS